MMALNIEGSRGDFTPSPFSDAQLDQIEEYRQSDLIADDLAVQEIIEKSGEETELDPELFVGEKDVAEFEPATDFLPPGTKLFVTGKGWDAEIGARLSGNTVGGASIGSETFDPRDNLDTVTGFVTLVPVPDTGRDQFALSSDTIIGNAVVRSPIIQPRASTVQDGQLFVSSENNIRALDGSGQNTLLYNTAIGTSHDLSFSDRQLAVASSDTDQLLVLDKETGELTRSISMIDHGYHLTIGTLPGMDRHGFYAYEDQVPVMNELRPDGVAVSSLCGLLTSRQDTQKVLTREQTTHLNSVEFIGPNTLLSTVFNTAVINEDGEFVKQPGGKVIMAEFNRYADNDKDAVLDELLADPESPWSMVQSDNPYDLPGGQGVVHRTMYGSKPGESLVIKQGLDAEGLPFTDVERVTVLADGLKNPHSVAKVADTQDGQMTLSVSNTSGGEMIYYQLDPQQRQMSRIGGLDFSRLPGLPESGNQWIHHAVKPVTLPDGTVATTVYDGSRKGIHILDLTNKQRMFVPVEAGAVVYQTQLVA